MSSTLLVSASVAVFTLEDEQIVWIDKLSQMNKSSDVQTGGTNFSTSKSCDICPFGKTICPSRRTSRRQYDINSHQEKMRRWDHGLLFTSNGQMPDDLSVQTSCSSCSVKVASESFVGKVLDLHTNLSLGKWLRSLESVVRRALFACFSSFVCPVASLQLSIRKLKILGTASFLNASRRDS